MRAIQRHVLFFCTVVAVGLSQPPSIRADSGVMLDAIVASVNGKPITVSELGARLSPPRKLTLESAAADPEARQLLDTLITERLVTEDAEARRMSASDEEIGRYIEEIAARNQMSIPDFEAALAKEGQSVTSYKEQVRLEILKGKLASAYVRGGVSVSDEELDQYMASNVASSTSDTEVTLRQIFVRFEGRSPEEARTKIAEASASLAEGESFEDVASEFSEGDERSQGGLLGTMRERDLSKEIFDAILLVKDGGISEVVESQNGLSLFFVEKRATVEKPVDEDQRAALRRQLQSQKLEERVRSFFTTELYKNYSVDKKI